MRRVAAGVADQVVDLGLLVGRDLDLTAVSGQLAALQLLRHSLVARASPGVDPGIVLQLAAIAGDVPGSDVLVVAVLVVLHSLDRDDPAVDLQVAGGLDRLDLGVALAGCGVGVGIAHHLHGLHGRGLRSRLV